MTSGRIEQVDTPAAADLSAADQRRAHRGVFRRHPVAALYRRADRSRRRHRIVLFLDTACARSGGSRADGDRQGRNGAVAPRMPERAGLVGDGDDPGRRRERVRLAGLRTALPVGGGAAMAAAGADPDRSTCAARGAHGSCGRGVGQPPGLGRAHHRRQDGTRGEADLGGLGPSPGAWRPCCDPFGHPRADTARLRGFGPRIDGLCRDPCGRGRAVRILWGVAQQGRLRFGGALARSAGAGAVARVYRLRRHWVPAAGLRPAMGDADGDLAR